MKKIKKLFYFWLIFLFPLPIWATTYWVGKSGSNGNSCGTASGLTDPGAANRKLTIQSGGNGGVSCLAAGDTLIIGDGTYNEQILYGAGGIPAGINISSPTILIAQNNKQAIILPTAPSTGLAVINIDQNYITIDGLIVDATNIQDNGGYYIRNDTITVTGVTIKNGIARNGTKVASGGGAEPNGILFCGHCSTMTVQNMEITNFRGHGIYLPSDDSLIENNNIHDRSANGGSETQYGIQIQSGNSPLGPYFATNNIVRRNTVAGWERGIIFSGSGGNGLNNLVYNNLVYGHVSTGILSRYGAVNSFIQNNTIYNNGGLGIQLYADSSASTVQNNINYLNSGGNYLDQQSGTVHDHNLEGTDPSFVNAAGNDFHILTGSAAKDAGTSLASSFSTDFDGNTRPQGSAWDIGAYEFLSTPPDAHYIISNRPRIKARIK